MAMSKNSNEKKLASTATKKASKHSDVKGSKHSNKKSNNDKEATKEYNDKMQREERRKTVFLFIRVVNFTK